MFSIRIRLRNLTRLLNSNRIKSTNHVVHRSYTVRRAMLYVPGNNLKMLKSALNLKVDCIAMDCEDGVAENMKDEARRTIRSLLSEGPVSKSDPEWCVRINCVQTGELCESDIDAVLSAKHLPAAIALPKVEHVDHLQWFAEKVWRKMTERPESDRGPINLLIFIESAKAVMNMREICQKAEDLSTMAPIVPVALVLGADDLLASLQALKTTDAQALLYSRQKLVLVAKAFGLQAIDMVNIDFKNLNLLQKEAREGALLGFTGKQIIHPSQVTIVQDEFVPSRTVIRRAQRLIEEFNRQQKEGKGAFVFEGVMIDMPSVRQAQNILKIATEAGKPVKELR